MQNIKMPIVVAMISVMVFLFQGCASSDVARGAASEADNAYLSSSYIINHTGEGSITNSYQNTSQTTKGVIVGGALGAAAGGASSLGAFPGLAVGAIFGGALGAYIDSHTSLSDKLINHGAQVVMLGDQVLIVLPSSIIFNEMSANINPDAYPTLSLVGQYISTLPNISVKVAAYTSGSISDRVTLLLSQQQADNIVKYLWKSGINTRLLYAAGYGSSNLVSASPAWSSDNYRVEITLEKLPV